MAPFPLTTQDIVQLAAKGISREQAMDQLALLRGGIPPMTLHRPCTLGDGILALTEPDLERNIARYETEAAHREILKFVPASGAATRMFKELIDVEQNDAFVEPEWFRAKAATGDRASIALLTVLENLPRFAFYEALTAISPHGEPRKGGEERERHDLRTLRHLLHPMGLNYSRLPKGLILFHRYPEGSRTAFEEHLMEATLYARGKDGVCRLHFTVSEGHMARFESLFNAVRRAYESRHSVRLEAGFSIQKSRTDTLSTDRLGQPFRNEDGSLLLRPGGHGALIDNLNQLNGDIVFIKNIDNVVQDRIKPVTTRYKKALAGHLLALQAETFGWLSTLRASSVAPAMVNDALAFGERRLNLIPPAGIRKGSSDTRRAWIVDRLNRPLRVCGMVKNEGEPGGGPFWVKESDRSHSLQIVEASAVAPSPSQQDILNAATHFNPVDLVCAIRDATGHPFDLTRFVNTRTAFITRKHKKDRELNALELPGLWNGGMAHWNTVFIEVPAETFNPVKTITDLLRKEHLPAD